jgi:long-subunit acyl-CoA synthetase (AMP-forming)
MDIQSKSVQEFVNIAENNAPDINDLFQLANDLFEKDTERKTIHTFLNLGHLPSVNSTIAENNLVEDWLELLIKLIVKSKYSFGHLFYNRANMYKHKVLFHEFHNGKVVNHTYEDIWEKLIKTAGALNHFENSIQGDMRVGILTPNCLRGAIIDLTCLSFHFPVIPIPANANKKDIDFIIKHSGITHLFIDEELHTELKDVERKTIHTFLNLGHLPSVNSTIAENNLVEDWLELLIKLIVKSKYSFGHLFYNRANMYKHKVLFHEFHNGKVVNHTYEDIWEKLIKTAEALNHFENSIQGDMRVGILTPNCLRGAIIDLTCLSFHFPVIPIPANANKKDIDFIIKHSGITHLFIDEELHTELKDVLIYNRNKITIVNLIEKDWHAFIAKRQSNLIL